MMPASISWRLAAGAVTATLSCMLVVPGVTFRTAPRPNSASCPLRSVCRADAPIRSASASHPSTRPARTCGGSAALAFLSTKRVARVLPIHLGRLDVWPSRLRPWAGAPTVRPETPFCTRPRFVYVTRTRYLFHAESSRAAGVRRGAWSAPACRSKRCRGRPPVRFPAMRRRESALLRSPSMATACPACGRWWRLRPGR